MTASVVFVIFELPWKRTRKEAKRKSFFLFEPQVCATTHHQCNTECKSTEKPHGIALLMVLKKFLKQIQKLKFMS